MKRLLSISLLVLAGCTAKPHLPEQTVTLATTTSTRDSGLLDVLVPMFEHETGIHVKVVAVGTGQALAMGRRGDADVLLTHAPPAEQKFIDEGYGSQRRPVMYNDFIIAGPAADAAEIQGQQSVVVAMRAISQRASPFVSRGDDSGTHMKERAIWKAAEIKPKGEWYLEAGGGMAHTLRVASEKQAYLLCDRSTYLAHKDRLELVILAEGDPLLRNPYAVILVNPEKHSTANHAAAQKFADFLTSASVRDVLATFGQAKYGQPLFFVLEE